MGGGPLKEKSAFLFNHIAYSVCVCVCFLFFLGITWCNAHSSVSLHPQQGLSVSEELKLFFTKGEKKTTEPEHKFSSVVETR